MKKLLHIQLLPKLTGVQRFSLHLLDGLDKAEYDIYIASKPGDELRQEAEKRGFTYITIPSFCHAISPLDLLSLFHLIFIIWRYKFDIVHTHSSKPGLLGRFAAWLCRVPIIVHTIHGTAFQEHQPQMVQKLYMLLELLAGTWCHKLAFVNHSDRLKYLSLKLIPENKAISIYNAIPIEQSSVLHTIAAQRSIPEDSIVIGSTIRFSTQKNAISLVTAACKASAQQPRLKFIFVGDGEHYELCKSIVRSYNAGNSVLLPGWDSDVIPWLRLFNAFVLYSRWEAQPFSIIEAMHSGIAVIGSAIPAIEELVNNECGYLVPLDNDAALVKAFCDVADNFPEAFNKGSIAKMRIEQVCDYHEMLRAYKAIYEGR